MTRFVTALAVAAILVTPAVAQELTDFGLPDEAYVQQYFGTQLVITASQPLDYPAEGWWTDVLPEELTYGSSYVTGLVNARRMDQDIKPLLDPDALVVNFGWEEETSDGYRYSIDFVELRPSEIELVFNALGGLEQWFPGCEIGYEPLLERNFVVSGESFDPLKLVVGTTELELDPSRTIMELHQQVAQALTAVYGEGAEFSISLYQDVYMDGSLWVNVNIYATLPAG